MTGRAGDQGTTGYGQNTDNPRRILVERVAGDGRCPRTPSTRRRLCRTTVGAEVEGSITKDCLQRIPRPDRLHAAFGWLPKSTHQAPLPPHLPNSQAASNAG